MARLPQVGGDEGSWGTILNDYLSQSHNADGTLKTDTVGAPQLKPNAVTTAVLANGAVSMANMQDGAVGTNQIADHSVSASKLQGAGQASGIATLDGEGRIPEQQLPARLGVEELETRFIRYVAVVTGTETRPSTAGVVLWIGGENRPINMTTGDVWLAGDGEPVATAPPDIITTSLDGMVKEAPFSQTVTATGSVPMTWSVSSGSLPDGIALNQSSGTISGTPTTSGAYSFALTASNSGGSDTQAFTGAVAKVPTGDSMSIFGHASPGTSTLYTDGDGSLQVGARFYATKPIRIVGARLWIPATASGVWLSGEVTFRAYVLDWTGSAFEANISGIDSPTAYAAAPGGRYAGTWAQAAFETPLVLDAISTESSALDCVLITASIDGKVYQTVADIAGVTALASAEDNQVYLAESSFARAAASVAGVNEASYFGVDILFEVV